MNNLFLAFEESKVTFPRLLFNLFVYFIQLILELKYQELLKQTLAYICMHKYFVSDLNYKII